MKTINLLLADSVQTKHNPPVSKTKQANTINVPKLSTIDHQPAYD